jgi:hypothetical protein
MEEADKADEERVVDALGLVERNQLCSRAWTWACLVRSPGGAPMAIRKSSPAWAHPRQSRRARPVARLRYPSKARFELFDLRYFTVDLRPNHIAKVKSSYFEATGQRCSASVQGQSGQAFAAASRRRHAPRRRCTRSAEARCRGASPDNLRVDARRPLGRNRRRGRGGSTECRDDAEPDQAPTRESEAGLEVGRYRI